MKKRFKLIPAVMVLLTTSYTVWGQAGKNQVTYTIDGGTFHHQQITINADPKVMENGAFTNTVGNYLEINLGDKAMNIKNGTKWGLNIVFNKASTGTAKVNDPIPKGVLDHQVYFTLEVQVNGETKFLGVDLQKPAKTPGTITITRFGSVGGTVEGNFQGTVTDAAGIKYTITGGHFVAGRKS
ncbi:hypothetical protein G7092_06935 [Mucilaginibacter sp. HC2]|uniref:hypothetical protein n=1 Tax=Mucilaginibacter inviolabilis TaxID=2714892 RepID=UPI00140B1F1D|nr:hypothetical protein [Mucilaginibacter inviolabilis]NHA03520.1 hypothetical protein [Mucilaginibacter inviolabilis]